MRLLLLPVLFVTCIGSAFAEQDPWMKPSDGYEWPGEAAAQPDKDTAIPLSKLPALVQAYLVDQYLPKRPPATILVRRADLNGDRVPEWFVDRPELGGTGGSVYNILDISGKAARPIGSLHGGFHLCAAAPKEKWLRIECSGSAGGGHFTRCLLQYIGGEFQTVRNEDHDMIHQKVVIGKNEKP